MMMHTDYIPSGFLAPLLQYISDRNIQAREVELELKSLLKEHTISTIQLCDFLEKIHKLDPVSALGFRLGKIVQPQNFGVIGYLVLSCNNLGQALSRYRRFQNVLQTGLKSWVTEEGNTIKIHWTQRTANTPLALEYSVAVFISLYQSLIDKVIPPLSVGLPFPEPAETSVYEALTGCPVQFSTDNLMVEIPAHLMSMRIASSDPYLRQLLERQAQAMMPQEKPGEADFNDFFDQLQEKLIDAMKDGAVSAETIADNMNYSLRSFYRKLNESGHSFRSVLADIRLRLAKQYLSDTSLSHSEVALLLGYSEQSSFIRAFRSWTGNTPGEYRERILKKQRQNNPEH